MSVSEDGDGELYPYAAAVEDLLSVHDLRNALGFARTVMWTGGLVPTAPPLSVAFAVSMWFPGRTFLQRRPVGSARLRARLPRSRHGGAPAKAGRGHEKHLLPPTPPRICVEEGLQVTLDWFGG